ncbi:copper resistance protein NlpE N-terminal domain-containing protein [Pontibacter sp. BT731]|uniref:copper resistance protein NlpE N-terminal domain-containing protein n=1 Tax=Pontibacter coccineus TaxID=3063328 RepID=UPI0026E4420A|nr:copper resistance protein NlpE N-terminal domain-containing protein [Pontibacter sp. BT731]MDO6389153.1 copper resistance protein NlpE N-terminal domain-containing protein [Pontibacter sp. BT731]
MDPLNRLLPIGMILLCIAAACSTEPTSVSQSNAPMSNAEVARGAVGSWEGTIPCADCPGIGYTLDLNPDSTYRERMVYQGRSATPFVQSGTWGVGNGRVQLKKQCTGNNQFALEGEALVMLDGDGNRIDSALADAYRLRRKSPDEPEDNPSLWREKYERGIDFAAIGNEPFWSLEIDLEKMIEFRLLDEEDGSVLTPIPVAEKPDLGEGTIYRVQTVTGNLEIRLMKETCVNTMTGRELPYMVTVLKDDTVFQGCGMYLRDSRLNGTWNLVELQGKKINPKDFDQNQPAMVIDLTEGKVSGSAGCNRITGTLEPIGDRINFGPLASTRMACPNMEVESQFLKVLSDGELRYRVGEERLELMLGGKVVAVFVRGD